MNRLPLIFTGSILLVVSLGVRAHGNPNPSTSDRTGKRNRRGGEQRGNGDK